MWVYPCSCHIKVGRLKPLGVSFTFHFVEVGSPCPCLWTVDLRLTSTVLWANFPISTSHLTCECWGHRSASPHPGFMCVPGTGQAQQMLLSLETSPRLREWSSSFCVSAWLVGLWSNISRSPGWPAACCAAKDDFVLLSAAPKCWDYKAPSRSFIDTSNSCAFVSCPWECSSK